MARFARADRMVDSDDRTPALSAAELERAFSLFTQASAELSAAYATLERRVGELTAQLAEANSEARRQLLAKEALSQRLSALLAALPGGVVVLDRSGRVVEANPAARPLAGEDVVGRQWAEVVAERLVATAAPDEWEIACGARERRRVHVSTSRFADAAQGEGMIVLLNDITGAHTLQQQLERAERLSAMGEMAARLAHNLRTPLATALLYAGNLARPGLGDGDRTRFAERTAESLRRVERMIQDMLRFVRGQGEATEATGEDIAVAALLAELGAVIEPQAATRGIAYAVRDDSRGAALRGSRKALTGAMLNLLENALQVTPPGGRIEVRASDDDGMLRLAVSDTGPGIDAATQARLFEPFFTTRSDGTGLGLAIVRSVARAHGGEAEVESASGRGACFTIRVPLC
jgi:two-component system sensor histidine kinase FlrB